MCRVTGIKYTCEHVSYCVHSACRGTFPKKSSSGPSTFAGRAAKQWWANRLAHTRPPQPISQFRRQVACHSSPAFFIKSSHRCGPCQHAEHSQGWVGMIKEARSALSSCSTRTLVDDTVDGHGKHDTVSSSTQHSNTYADTFSMVSSKFKSRRRNVDMTRLELARRRIEQLESQHQSQHWTLNTRVPSSVRERVIKRSRRSTSIGPSALRNEVKVEDVGTGMSMTDGVSDFQRRYGYLFNL